MSSPLILSWTDKELKRIAIPAFKLFKARKDGSLGSLFINAAARLPLDEWLEAQDFPTKGYARRPGWHTSHQAIAPHLSLKGREWRTVLIAEFVQVPRPLSQGGVWLIAKWMKILSE